MRVLTQNELAFIQGGFAYWNPEQHAWEGVWDCDAFGCTPAYGYW